MPLPTAGWDLPCWSLKKCPPDLPTGNLMKAFPQLGFDNTVSRGPEFAPNTHGGLLVIAVTRSYGQEGPWNLLASQPHLSRATGPSVLRNKVLEKLFLCLTGLAVLVFAL